MGIIFPQKHEPTGIISTSGKRPVKILVASPGDVDRERKIVEEVIAEWCLSCFA
jgi:hypothetical protein